MDLAREAMRPEVTREALVPAVQNFIEQSKGASRTEARAAIEALAPAFRVANAEAFAFTATAAGYLVERGADPGHAAEVFAERLVTVAAGASRLAAAATSRLQADRPRTEAALADLDDFEERFDAARSDLRSALGPESQDWETLSQLLAPALAILGASPAARDVARRSGPDLKVLEPVHYTASCLAGFLRVLYDEPFVAIEPSTTTAIRGRMSGISQNFQLNVLLMDVFPRAGLFAPRRVSKSAAAVARGDSPHQTGETVTGAWDMFGWPVLTRGVSLPRGDNPAFMEYAIWNEGIPADIPKFGGWRVIVLGPASYTRIWPSQREFPHLRAALTEVERLSEAEALALLERMRREPPPPRESGL